MKMLFTTPVAVQPIGQTLLSFSVKVNWLQATNSFLQIADDYVFMQKAKIHGIVKKQGICTLKRMKKEPTQACDVCKIINLIVLGLCVKWINYNITVCLHNSWQLLAEE